jgi:hypothetical protein
LEAALAERDARVGVLTRRVAELEALLRKKLAHVVQATVLRRAGQAGAPLAAGALGTVRRASSRVSRVSRCGRCRPPMRC